jgi:hypothetical protein
MAGIFGKLASKESSLAPGVSDDDSQEFELIENEQIEQTSPQKQTELSRSDQETQTAKPTRAPASESDESSEEELNAYLN